MLFVLHSRMSRIVKFSDSGVQVEQHHCQDEGQEISGNSTKQIEREIFQFLLIDLHKQS